jgi:hypothetical protein
VFHLITFFVWEMSFSTLNLKKRVKNLIICNANKFLQWHVISHTWCAIQDALTCIISLPWDHFIHRVRWYPWPIWFDSKRLTLKKECKIGIFIIYVGLAIYSFITFTYSSILPTDLLRWLFQSMMGHLWEQGDER